MKNHRLSPTIFLIFLSSTIFLAMTVAMMMGPLLTALAEEFHTSVAVAGQLASMTAVSWALTAFVAGPVSDTWGRRPMMLLGLFLVTLGTMASAFASSYGMLLVSRLLTGVGAAFIPPNTFAAVADFFPPARRGKAMGWVISASGLGTAFGIPMVAILTEMGGWRLPFMVLGTVLVIIMGLLWVWFPGSKREENLSFLAHLRGIAGQRGCWYLLIANGLQVTAFMGMSSYLAAYMMETYGMSAGETAMPLTLAGLGVIAGSMLGGKVTILQNRLTVITLCFAGGGVAALFMFTVSISQWVTVGLAFGVSTMLILSWPVTTVLLLEIAGHSKATATGLFAVSNQLGFMGGASIGGVVLSLGDFSAVGVFCFVMTVGAVLIMHYKVKESNGTAHHAKSVS